MTPATTRTRASGRRPAEELLLSIGALTGHLTFEGAPQPFVSQARARYDAFTLPPAPQVLRSFSLRLRFEPARPPRARGASATEPSGMVTRPLKVTATDSTIKVERWDFQVTLRRVPGGTRGEPRFSGTGRCTMSPFALDSLLRVLWSVLVPRSGGALVHACGLRHAELAVVFPGVSGVGKTTLARKAPDADDVLSDEMMVLRPLSGGGWRAYGTPFWGDFARGGISMRGWPLRCIGFLAQAPSVAMTPVTSSEAALRLLACFVCFQTDGPTVERNLAVAVKLCGDVRAVEARLTRDAPAAEVFRKLAPHIDAAAARKAPPATAREMISELRAMLRRERRYTVKPKSGDALLVQSATAGEAAPGDILLAWTPGRTPADDTLACTRVPAGATAARAPRTSEVLGKVRALSRDGRTTAKVPGRVGDLPRLLGSLVTPSRARLSSGGGR